MEKDFISNGNCCAEKILMFDIRSNVPQVLLIYLGSLLSWVIPGFITFGIKKKEFRDAVRKAPEADKDAAAVYAAKLGVSDPVPKNVVMEASLQPLVFLSFSLVIFTETNEGSPFLTLFWTITIIVSICMWLYYELVLRPDDNGGEQIYQIAQNSWGLALLFSLASALLTPEL